MNHLTVRLTRSLRLREPDSERDSAGRRVHSLPEPVRVRVGEPARSSTGTAAAPSLSPTGTVHSAPSPLAAADSELSRSAREPAVAGPGAARARTFQVWLRQSRFDLMPVIIGQDSETWARLPSRASESELECGRAQARSLRVPVTASAKKSL
eukprot:451154-Rhodomonas_salina.3